MRRKPYPSDLSDEEWAKLQPLLPSSKRGAPRRVNLREVINALRYLARTGCQWRMLPHDLPSWETVYYYFSQWRDDGTWERLNCELRIQVRLSVGKDPEPTAAILDSQSVKATEMTEARGYDAGKKVNGIKRHMLVDTLGLVLKVMVLTADIQDRDGARLMLEKIKQQFPRLQKIWADGGYAGTVVDWVKQVCGWILEIVKRPAHAKGFEVLPHRWIVERTFGWLNRFRRLSKGYERLAVSEEAMVYLAMITLM
ncbi:MAG: IS5 family transposase, partial [Anaerolineae bacterium]|nr:IS5 family transposase [Anaerolineae bacterium]